MSQFLKTLPLSFFRTVVSSRPIFQTTSSVFWSQSFPQKTILDTWQNLVGTRFLHRENKDWKLFKKPANNRGIGIAKKFYSKKSKKKCGKLKCRIVAKEGGKATIDCIEDDGNEKKESTEAQRKEIEIKKEVKEEEKVSPKKEEEKAPPKEEVSNKIPASIQDFCKQKLREKLEKEAEAARKELEEKLAKEAEAAEKLLNEKILKEKEAAQKALDELQAKEKKECKNKKEEKKEISCKKEKKCSYKKFKFPCPDKVEKKKSCPDDKAKKSKECEKEKPKNCEKDKPKKCEKKTKLCVDSCNDK